MKISLPNDHRRDALKELKAHAQGVTGGQWCVTFFLLPHLVDTDELREAVRGVLKCPWLGYRHYAGSILDALNDPDGLRHIVFNALKTHPIEGFDHTMVRSGWTDVAVTRRAHGISKEMVEALLGDMLPPKPNGCVDSLSRARSDLVVDGARELLSYEGDSALFGACILAAHGEDQGVDLIIRASRSGDYPVLTQRSLAWLRTEQTLGELESAGDPEYVGYSAQHEEMKQCYARAAKVLLGIARATLEGRFEDEFEAVYRQKVVSIPYNIKPKPFNPYAPYKVKLPDDLHVTWIGSRQSYGIPSPADCLVIFSTEQDRERIARRQMESMSEFLAHKTIKSQKLGSFRISHLSPSPLAIFSLPQTEWESLGMYPKGVTVELDDDDLREACAKWIRHPESHYQGTATSLYAPSRWKTSA